MFPPHGARPSYHAVAGVANFADRALAGGGGIARPARAAVIFGAAVEQRCAAAGTAIDAVALVIDIFAGEGAFGAAFPQHMMGHRVERGAGFGGPGIGHDGGLLGMRRAAPPVWPQYRPDARSSQGDAPTPRPRQRPARPPPPTPGPSRLDPHARAVAPP